MKNYLKYLHEILTLIGEDRRKLPMMGLLFLIASLLDLAGLGLIAPYISLLVKPNQAVDGQIGQMLAMFNWNLDRETLILCMSGVLVFLFLCKAIGSLAINFVIFRFSQNQQIRLRLSLMNTYQHLPYSVYSKRNSSEYIQSLQVLTTNFQGVLYQLLRSVSDAMVALFILFLLIFENAIALGLLMFLIGSTLFGYDRLFRKRMSDYGRRQNIAGKELIQGIHEGLEGLKEMRILGRESYFYQMVQRGAENWAFNQRRYQVIQQVPRYLFEVVLVIFVVLLILLALYLETSTGAMLGTLGLFGVATIRIVPIATMFAGTLTTLRFSRDTISRLYADLEDLIVTRKRNCQVSKIPEPFVSLKLDDVQYSYPNSKFPTIKGLSLEIQAGDSIGLVGPSGSGKTTLVDVLLGLLEPQSGTLKFNGIALEKRLEVWRTHVAYLPQEVFLIDNTLEQNVVLGEYDKKIDEHRLRESLFRARLTQLVKQLPQGVNTKIGERGVRLSGGQRQRVALARAFYHGRSVLVMDEATSALDNETEREIVEEIKLLKGQKTMIVIAHRFSTVQYCDKIHRLEQGRIMEEGSSQEVLYKDS